MNGLDERDFILQGLNASFKQRQLYPAGHPATTAPLKKGFQQLSEALRHTNNIAVGLVNEALVYEEDPVEDSEKLYPELLERMGEMGVEALIFEKGMSEKELAGVVDILSAEEKLAGQKLQNELHARGITHITLKTAPIGRQNIVEIYNDAVEVVTNVMNEVRMGKIPSSGPVNDIVDEMADTVFTDQDALIGLTMIKNYDNYLFNHSVNVSILSLSLGRFMGLEKEDLHTVGVAALLHDVGKTGVSENIIRKPGGLSSEEWEKIKEHPRLGSNITKRMDSLDELVGRLVFEHHIKFDQSGYPESDRSPHPLSQIITICDAYDALTTLRVYQKPHNPAEAAKVMSNFSGRHFDPKTLEAFLNMIGVYPVGTMVRLSTGEIGVVTGVNQDHPDSPMVKVLYGSDGKGLGEQSELDLSKEADKTIIATVNPAATTIRLDQFFEKEAS